jgi:hypothetical protein
VSDDPEHVEKANNCSLDSKANVALHCALGGVSPIFLDLNSQRPGIGPKMNIPTDKIPTFLTVVVKEFLLGAPRQVATKMGWVINVKLRINR